MALPHPLAGYLQQLEALKAAQPAGTGLDPLTAFLAEFEPALLLGSALAGSAPAGLAGLADLVTGEGVQEAADTVGSVAEALTYTPQTKTGLAGSQELLEAIEPVMELSATVPEAAGGLVADITGSPAAATVTELVADPLNFIPGAKTAAAVSLPPAASLAAIVTMMNRGGDVRDLGLAGLRERGMFAPGREVGETLAHEAGDDSVMRATRLAEELEAAGKTPEEVWQATGNLFAREGRPWAGMYRGVDGIMRVEIPDDQARLISTPTLGEVIGGEVEWDAAHAPNVLEHELLYRAVPEARQLEVYADTPGELSVLGPGTRGEYDPIAGSVTYASNLPRGSEPNVIGHETEHFLQDLYGMARGSSPGEYIPPASAIEQMAEQEQVLGHALAVQEQARQAGVPLAEFLASPAAPNVVREGPRATSVQGYALTYDRPTLFDEMMVAGERRRVLDTLRRNPRVRQARYESGAGESEARQVQARWNLTPEERRARFPDLDFDVPRDEQEVFRTRYQGPKL